MSCADLYPGDGPTPFLVTGSQYFPPTDDVMLLGHVPRPTPPPTWAPAYAAAAAAAAAATYYRYAVASIPSPCSPSPFTRQFLPAGYLGVNDPLTPVGGYCGSSGARDDNVEQCLKSLRCSLYNSPAHSTPSTSWQRSRGKCVCVYNVEQVNIQIRVVHGLG